MVVLAALALAAQLQSARIELVLDSASARAEARYEFAEPAGAVRFVLIRRPGQTVRWDERSPLGTREQPGLIEITSRPVGRTVTLRYTATGRLTRIPIPVPDQPAGPGSPRPPVHVVVHGLAPGARLAEAFPHLRLAAPGTAEAALAHVPSLVRLPPEPGRRSAGRLMEWLVGLLAGGGAAFGLIRAWRRSEGRAAPRAAP